MRGTLHQLLEAGTDAAGIGRHLDGLAHAERLMLHELLHILGYLDREHTDDHEVNMANMRNCLGITQ